MKKRTVKLSVIRDGVVQRAIVTDCASDGDVSFKDVAAMAWRKVGNLKQYDSVVITISKQKNT